MRTVNWVPTCWCPVQAVRVLRVRQPSVAVACFKSPGPRTSAAGVARFKSPGPRTSAAGVARGFLRLCDPGQGWRALFRGRVLRRGR